MAEIELDRICKRFPDGTVAVSETSLTIGDGEFFILVGPSGCGKSTLLNLIVGLAEPSGGAIRVDGVDITDRDPRERNMAMVFQSYAIYPHLTVRENLAFPLRIAKVGRAAIAERVERAAGLLELEELLDRRPAELSGGQRQRVAMGRAIVREPDAFLLDEPLSNLDARLRVQMRAELARLHDRLGTTTVYVTHDQTEAMTLGDRVAVQRNGEVQQVGTPRELYEDPVNLFVAGFVGAPAMNFMPAVLSGRRLELPMARIELPDDGADRGDDGDRPVIAGIRPEHLPDAVAAGDGAVAFDAGIDRVEWLGADQYVYFTASVDADRYPAELFRQLELDPCKTDAVQWVARVDADQPVNPEERLSIALDPRRIMLFDADTGGRIR